MRELQFQWDDLKNISNQHKHGIAFEEAQSAFFDERGRFQEDPDHSQIEQRYLLLAKDVLQRVLVISFCWRAQETVRIISARKAGRKERDTYERKALE